MIRRLVARVPGPPAVGVLLIAIVALVTLALLGLLYEWLGSNFLDTGGRIG